MSPVKHEGPVGFKGLDELPTGKIEGLLEERDLGKLNAEGGVDSIASRLGLNTSTGYCETDAERRRELYGPNVVPERPSPSFLALLWDAYSDKTLILLTAAAAISLGVGIWEHVQLGERGWIEGVAIAAAILIVVLVNAFNDWHRDRQFRMLSARVRDRRVTVLRPEGKVLVSVFDLVVGDIVCFEPGEVLPADGLLVDGQRVTIDESGMTGESDAVKKSPESDPFLLSGTRVIDGTGQMMVLAVGLSSLQGRMVNVMQSDETAETPLQAKLDRLAGQIATYGTAAATLMAVVLVVKYVVLRTLHPPWPAAVVIVHSLMSILIQAVTVVVVAVPEGLPMAVTIALAYATTQMLSDNNLVRVLAACETMGGATSICSDKTGTMTENKMTVVKYTVGLTIKHRSDSYGADTAQLLAESIAVNSTASELQASGWIGSKTEVALLNFATDCLGMPAQYYETARSKAKVLGRVPFSSERKKMLTAVEEYRNGRPVFRVFLKGASEMVLAACSTYIDSGKESALDPDAVRKVIKEMAGESLRTIGLAYKDVRDPSEFAAALDSEEGLELMNEFCLMAVVGIEDPLRRGVEQAVAQCQRAGIMVRMVTGDNMETARAIAAKAGILQRGGLVLEGIRFRTMSDAELSRELPRLQVLARSSPLDKRILVRKLREMGEIVAVTGDGTNDGPALKAAHVGFSMGIAGTEVAKEASAIVLLDDNFSSIVRAVSWGRAVNDSVRRFLQFQLTINLTAVVVAAVTAVLDADGKSALTAVQLLWVNLIMDSYRRSAPANTW